MLLGGILMHWIGQNMELPFYKWEGCRKNRAKSKLSNAIDVEFI